MVAHRLAVGVFDMRHDLEQGLSLHRLCQPIKRLHAEGVVAIVAVGGHEHEHGNLGQLAERVGQKGGARAHDVVVDKRHVHLMGPELGDCLLQAHRLTHHFEAPGELELVAQLDARRRLVIHNHRLKDHAALFPSMLDCPRAVAEIVGRILPDAPLPVAYVLFSHGIRGFGGCEWRRQTARQKLNAWSKARPDQMLFTCNNHVFCFSLTPYQTTRRVGYHELG